MPSRFDNDTRVILLLDLDCFYAQSECVRLGWRADQIPLALMQWNSALAVSYPARKFGIKRGDSFEKIHEKSAGSCFTVSVPLLTTAAAAGDEEATSQNGEFSNSYESIFCLTKDQQEAARKRDLGQRHYHSQGKACIERYRVASKRIFDTVLEWIQQHTGSTSKTSIVLEKASIDEFFLDVTAACREDGKDPTEDAFLDQTVIVAKDHLQTGSVMDEKDSETRALLRGCQIAGQIRKTVLDKLGFTISAGVAGNKMLAKLSASHGKPNGQAVTFPVAVPWLLQNTRLKDCRNLGGKLGKRVTALLPQSTEEPSMSAITKYLSLPDLQRGLGGDDVASWVYAIAQGHCEEPVQAKNESAATKSVTAFKSLPGIHDLLACEPWIRLLAQEVTSRVAKDSAQHFRYPKTCTVQYALASGPSAANKGRTNNKSVRIAFPKQRLPMAEQVEDLVERVPVAVRSKEGDKCIMIRIGLCAVEFTARESSNPISSYFKEATPDINRPESSKTQARSAEDSTENEHADQEVAERIDEIENAVANFTAPDEDLKLAKKLQASYDRENRVLELLEKKATQRPPKTRKIDSFFAKR